MSEATENTATETTEEQRKTPVPAPVKAERVEQNGITKPKDGTKTGDVWAISDAISAKLGEPAPRKEVLDACEKKGINPATAATQYGKWRTFHGLVGERAPKSPAVEKEAKPAKAAKKGKGKAAETASEPAGEAPAPEAPAPAPQAPPVTVEEDEV